MNNKKMLIGGGAIRRLTRSINRGTLGVILETKESKSIDKKYYGLTCSHVVKENSKIQYRNTSNHKYEIIGKVKHKNKISNLDYALIEIDKDYGFIPQEGIISRNSISNPDPLNIPKEGDNVHKYGSSTFSTNGYIESVYLKYVVNNKISIKHFLINTKNGCYFSSLGDSGSLVIDDKNNPIGIARALDGTKTIVIPINNILKSLKEHNFNHNFKFDFI